MKTTRIGNVEYGASGLGYNNLAIIINNCKGDIKIKNNVMWDTQSFSTLIRHHKEI